MRDSRVSSPGSSTRLVAAVILGLVAGGCASPTASGGAPVAVELSEWVVAPSTSTASAGSVTFAITNAGTQFHEFVVVKTDLSADALPVIDHQIDESTLTPVGEVKGIAVGATPTLSVDLATGHYVLLCNVETHYERGMHADFEVS